VAAVFDYWKRRYVDVIERHIDLPRATLADGGAGFGWLPLTYLLCGGKHAILIEPHTAKLQASREIAAILGVAHRCTFHNALLQEAPLAERSVDAVASIETLEHVGAANIAPCIRKMATAADRLILLTTPNRAFPIDSHDTHLPFCHWLPKRMRRSYARLFGYNRRVFNDYAGPWDLKPIWRDFRPISRVLMFETLQAWRASYPYLSPYRRGVLKRQPSPSQAVLYGITSRSLGRWSFLLSNNLASVWLRR
jgi:hypothetical protein